ncbi:unnamed protein product [Caenorhabditis bovis]|uniref:RING-type domain-containing protein n=1 Tax=Caenorhabditis bovis TaxID=2654633 RepID=A0A8S1FC54_9PELO|nr:unnamed protein product [Caenorhabditis bovis]
MSTSSDDHSDKECPLCMEVLELDDIDFYPCKCEYQICRFCWHRIRTDENGLCPACRQPYPEDPVNFKPLSSSDVQRHKNEKRMKKQAEKMRISETRQHLANYRVLQKNLVYVVGLSTRVADPETLKKPEYFGRFGKILKVVTSIAPSVYPHQHLPPSHTAYVTYKKVEEALRAIQECMYLHENADPEISFTKDDMHAGKHTEYEKKLIETVLNRPPPPTPTVANIIEKSITLSKPAPKPAQPKTISQWEAANDGGDEMDDAAESNEDAGERLDDVRAGSSPQNNSPSKSPRDAPDNTSCKSNDSASVEDPAPSNVSTPAVKGRRSNASARDRQWSERDEFSVAQSHSPPTDPEANDADDNNINRLDEMMSKLSHNDNDDFNSFFGVPAPAEHNEAPAPLVNWQTLLGLAPAAPFPAPEPENLFSSLAWPPSTATQSSLSTTTKRLAPSPPPGLARFASEDDLGFDPFAESSKGLSALLQEEQEQPRHNHMPVFQPTSLTQFLMQNHVPHQQQQQQEQGKSSLMHALHQQQQQQQQAALLQQQQQQSQVPFGQPPSSMASLWQSSVQSMFSNNYSAQSQLASRMQQQQQSNFDPFSSSLSLQFLQQQQQQLAQQQQQQQNPQPNSFFQEMVAARNAAANTSMFSHFQQPHQSQQQQQQHHHHDMFGIAPPPGLPARPSASATQQMHHQFLFGAGSTQQQQQQQQQQSQQQSNQSSSQSMQEMFKALLPNVNVRFMDDSTMSRLSHENSLRSNGQNHNNVLPPPGFSSVLNP